MGLLDAFTTDPEQQRALMQGLLSGAFGAMAGRGSKLQAWGQGGLSGLMGYQGSLDRAQQGKQQELQNQRQALQDQLTRGQVANMQRQQQVQALPGQFFQAPSAPTVDATGGMDTAAENPANSNAGRMDMPGYINALMGLDPVQALQMQQATRVAEPKLQEVDPTKTYGTWQGGQFTPAITGSPKVDLPSGMRIGANGQPEWVPGYLEGRERVSRAGASSVSYGQPIAGVDDKGNPVFFQQSKSGGAPAIVPNVRPNLRADKDLTDAQAKANLFGTRAQEADKILTTTGAPSVAQQMTNPSGITGRIATASANPKQQQADQAQRDFINAVLRRESGAVIADSEFANARLQYFPQPGDSKEVIEQKARNRQIASEGILAEVPQARRGVPSLNKGSESDPLGLRGGR